MWTKKDEIEHLKDCLKGRADLIKHLSKELTESAKKSDELRGQLAEKDAEIKELNRQLTEKELYEKKCKEWEKKIHDLGTIELTKGTQFNILMDRLIKLEAKFEAQENPYFF